MNIKKKLEKYLSDNLERKRAFFGSYAKAAPMEDYCSMETSSINNYINDNKEEDTFQTKLFNYID